ncbi:MAG TPA: hypothetical protein VK553_09665 [Candidatus Nitrosopolaris rasttigaisensis]|nr:hypothetical protein [Candidatus Nitrosopolaris rasttigaisensis]
MEGNEVIRFELEPPLKILVIVEKSPAKRIVDDVLNATSTDSDIAEANVLGSKETGDVAL